MEVLILGMHRSGTSLVSGIINKLGVYGGDETTLSRSGEWNPKGYWEFRKLNQTNNRILEALGARWDRVAGLDDTLLQDPRDGRISGICNELAPTLEAFGKQGDWAVKDPRMCLLLPAWRKYFSNPVAVMVVRDPLEVAISLNKRNQMPLVVGAALWEFYTKSALQHSQDMPRIFVNYNTLLENPAHEILRVQKSLANLGVKVLSDARNALELVDGSLYRSRRSGISSTGLLNQQQAALYETMRLENPTGDGVSRGGLEILALYEQAFPESSVWERRWQRLAKHFGKN